LKKGMAPERFCLGAFFVVEERSLEGLKPRTQKAKDNPRPTLTKRGWSTRRNEEEADPSRCLIS
jgi:hypothetical protein